MAVLAPIILFCYNRADKTKAALDNLSKNTLARESELFIFCDGPRNEVGLEKIKEVHQVIDSVTGFKNVVIEKRNLNFGVANSIIYGVSKILDQYKKAIIIEDDIVVSPNFLEFINDALNFYETDPKIFCVTGFNYPNYKIPQNYYDDIFFLKGRNCSWGWGIWKNRWDKVDFKLLDYNNFKKDKIAQKAFNRTGDNLFTMLKMQAEGKIDAWDIQVTYYMFKNNLYCVFPVKTMVKNIGFDGSGIHCHVSKKIADFDFNDITKINLKKLDQISNNKAAESVYISFHKDKFFDRTIFNSKKKQLRLKYIIIGFLFCELFHLIYRFF